MVLITGLKPGVNQSNRPYLKKAIQTDTGKENGADKSVALKKSAIDAGDVERARAAMLEKQRPGNKSHGAEVNWPEPRNQAEGNQGKQKGQVEQLRQPEAALNSQTDHHGMKPFLFIEIKVLGGIDQIKPGHPTNNSRGKDKRSKIDI